MPEPDHPRTYAECVEALAAAYKRVEGHIQMGAAPRKISDTGMMLYLVSDDGAVPLDAAVYETPEQAGKAAPGAVARHLLTAINLKGTLDELERLHRVGDGLADALEEARRCEWTYPTDAERDAIVANADEWIEKAHALGWGSAALHDTEERSGDGG